jgi:hypothetical protein
MPPSDSLQAFYDHKLNQLRVVFEKGNPLALRAAIHYCAKYKLARPDWVTQGALAFAFRSGNLPKKRGRSSGEIPRYREDIWKHYARWELVEEIRDAQAECQTEIEELRRLPGLKAKQLRRQLELRLKKVGTTMESAIAVASELLASTFAEGGEAAIKRSYDTVRRERENPGRFYLFDEHFLKSIGAMRDSLECQVNISEFFRDLTE